MREPANYLILLHVFIGVYLAGAGAGVLNQFLERDTDARMTRTGLRPLPARRFSARRAFYFGISLAVIGIIYLTLFTTWIAAVISLVTLIVYLAIYTPMKRRTPAALYLGGIAGALPPIIGWTAVTQEISLGGFSLSLILFFWQIPHFLSLAWIYREDYERAGYKVSTVVDPSGVSAGRQIIYHCLLLIPVAILPTLTGLAGLFFLYVAIIMSLIFFAAGLLFNRKRKETNARKLFIVSILYLPLLYAALIVDRLLT